MEYNTVSYEKKGRVTYIKLNRPQVLNAFNYQLYKDLEVAFSEFDLDEESWICIIHGEGRSFSAAAAEDARPALDERRRAGVRARRPAIHQGCLVPGVRHTASQAIRVDRVTVADSVGKADAPRMVQHVFRRSAGGRFRRRARPVEWPLQLRAPPPHRRRLWYVRPHVPPQAPGVRVSSGEGTGCGRTRFSDLPLRAARSRHRRSSRR